MNFHDEQGQRKEMSAVVLDGSRPWNVNVRKEVKSGSADSGPVIRHPISHNLRNRAMFSKSSESWNIMALSRVQTRVINARLEPEASKTIISRRVDTDCADNPQRFSCHDR